LDHLPDVAIGNCWYCNWRNGGQNDDRPMPKLVACILCDITGMKIQCARRYRAKWAGTV